LTGENSGYDGSVPGPAEREGMSEKYIRGAQDDQSIREDYIVRDTRNAVTKAVHWLKVPTNMTTALVFLAALAFLFPAVSDVCLLVACGLSWFGLTRPETAPLKLPAQSGLLDPHERHPGTGKPLKANGIFFLGNELKTGKEVWLTNSDCRQHFLVLGTTGAGKTETLLGFAANAIAWGSGFLFCDGKGDVSLFAKVYALARRFGREDDLLVLNYMTGNQDLGSAGGKIRSNTLNPFATGSSDTLTQMVVGLMDDAGGDGAMWKGRATAMFTGVMRALTWLRDKQVIDLNVSEIRDHLNLKRIIDLADKSKYPDLPQPIRKSIKSYLTSLPGYQEEKGHRQGQTTLDQHGYLEMQFTKILGSLADVYGYIFHTPYGEIDMADVVLNRRILVIMLPALEKSGDEIANLGKIVVATLKGMMGGTLGSQIEGSWNSVVENRPTNSPSPFIVILDEVGYYMVDGMDLMAAQARSLGFSLIFAGQDINAMKRLNEKVYGSVQGNTNTKIIMRTEDTDTVELAKKAAGEIYRAQQRSFEGKVKEIGSRAYIDNLEAALERVERINSLDLKAQDEGEMHILHKDWLVRAKSFYANPEGAISRKNLKLRANHFITVTKPDPEEIASQQRLPEIVQRLADPDFARQMKIDAENASSDLGGTGEIPVLAATFAQLGSSTRRPSSPVEAACVALAKLASMNREITESYARDVRTAAGGRGHPVPADFGFDAEDDEESIPVRRRPEIPDMPVGTDTSPRPVRQVPPAKSPPSRPQPRPFAGTRVKKDVPHGVAIDNGEVHHLADRLQSNESVIKALAAMDFDAKDETPQSVDEAIEEALMLNDDYDDVSGEPFEDGEIEKASGAIRTALPDFGDDDEDDAGGGTVDQFLTSLLDPEDDD